MKTQLCLDLTAHPRRISIHFRDSAEVEETLQELRNQDIAVMEIDGSSLATREDLFKAFAIALQKPKGWYGDEEYAPNVDAFLSISMTLLNGCLRRGTLCSCATRNGSGAQRHDWLASLSNGGSSQYQVTRGRFICCLFGDVCNHASLNLMRYLTDRMPKALSAGSSGRRAVFAASLQ